MIVRRTIERIGPSGIFLLLVFLIYVIVGMAAPGVLGDTLHLLGKVVVRVLPLLLFVFGVMFVINLFFEAKKGVTFFSRKSGLKGWGLAILGGIISAGPIYMWYPLLSDLRDQGMKNSLIATFLYNRAIKIPLLPMVVYYFGWAFAVVLSIYMVLFSIINGIVVERLTGGESHP